MKKDREGIQEEIANYFGLVEVIDGMENCSLMRYRDREFVASTNELQASSSTKQAT